MKKFVIFVLFFLNFSHVFWFTQSEEQKIWELLKNKTYIQQIEILEKLDGVLKIQINKDYISNLKKQIISDNLKQILIDSHSHYLSQKDSYKQYFQILQNLDNEASMNPYYFIKLKEKISENDMYFKSFIYMYYEIKENLKKDLNYYVNNTDSLLDAIKNSTNYLKTNILDRETFDFLKMYKYNYLSNRDLYKFQKYILTYHIGTDSKIFQYFIEYKNFLSLIHNNKIFLYDEFDQKLQNKKLSCEMNSASLFASYILKKDISEEEIFSKIPQWNEKIQKKWKYFIWGNPYREFVWDINGNQTKNIEEMTWYWVYAEPIYKALHSIGIPTKITSFNTDTIVKSLLQNQPIIFWYLTENKLWELNTKSISWKTKDGQKIYWYIWEHTGVIVGISLFDNGNINEVYFYEWKHQEMQTLKYNDFKYQTSFFDIMITKE